MNSEYNRKEIKQKVGGTYEVYTGDDDIDDLIEWAQEVKEQGATGIEWSGSGSCNWSDFSGTIEANAYYTIPEPDEQYHERIGKLAEKEKIENDKRLAREREQYEALKLKFENK